jgi:hypothetical protein
MAFLVFQVFRGLILWGSAEHIGRQCGRPAQGVDFFGMEQRKTSFLGEENENMLVTEITTPVMTYARPEHDLTPEQLANECNYIRAEKITRKMLEKGLITQDEFDKIMEENRKSFSPYLASLY